MRNHKLFGFRQHGSAMMIVVFGIAVAITFMLMGIIHYNTQYTIDQQKKNVDVYLQDCQDRVEKWYERNAATKELTELDFSPATATTNGVSTVLDETLVMQEADIKRQFSLRILVSNVFDSELKNNGGVMESIADPLTAEYHRNIRYRKLYCVIVNPESSGEINLGDVGGPITDTHVMWHPDKPGRVPLSALANLDASGTPVTTDKVSQTPDQMTLYIDPAYSDSIKYAVIDGFVIQKKKMGETISYLTTVSKMLEARFKAKFEADPFHNIGWNHFRPGQVVIPDSYATMGADQAVSNGATINVGALAAEDELPETIRCVCSADSMTSGPNCGLSTPYLRKDNTVFDGRWTLGSGSMLNSFYRPMGYMEIGSDQLCGPAWAASGTITQSMQKLLGGNFPQNDAWGNPIMISNKTGPDPATASNPNYGGSGATSKPPFTIPVIALSPWGTTIVVNALQPVN
jgi:hypothetical protein